jgi:threonine/homoserine efflux transporter RhtA
MEILAYLKKIPLSIGIWIGLFGILIVALFTEYTICQEVLNLDESYTTIILYFSTLSGIWLLITVLESLKPSEKTP